MLDKFIYNIFEGRISRNIYIKPKISILCKTFPEISKSNLFGKAAILSIAKMVQASTSQVASIKILK